MAGVRDRVARRVRDLRCYFLAASWRRELVSFAGDDTRRHATATDLVIFDPAKLTVVRSAHGHWVGTAEQAVAPKQTLVPRLL